MTLFRLETEQAEGLGSGAGSTIYNLKKCEQGTEMLQSSRSSPVQ